MPLLRFPAPALVLLTLTAAVPAAPLVLNLPQPAAQTVAATSALGDLLLPSGPYAAGQVPGARLPGRVAQTVWRIGQPMATIDLMQRLRGDVLAAGFQPVFECQAQDCGGFDFRYAIAVLPEPDMHVDLSDFRFLAARKDDEGLTLMVSRSQQAAFVQIMVVGPAPPTPAAQANATAEAGADATGGQSDPAQPPPLAAPQPVPAPPPDTGDVVTRLQAQGHVALDDLAFASGKGGLQPGTYASLSTLAAWLLAHPDARVALVGHTDATGGLAGNIALSRARAQSVRQALVALGVPAAQMAAEGVGYLAPRAASLTSEGQAANRRVEVVLTSTQVQSATTEP